MPLPNKILGKSSAFVRLQISPPESWKADPVFKSLIEDGFVVKDPTEPTDKFILVMVKPGIQDLEGHLRALEAHIRSLQAHLASAKTRLDYINNPNYGHQAETSADGLSRVPSLDDGPNYQAHESEPSEQFTHLSDKPSEVVTTGATTEGPEAISQSRLCICKWSDISHEPWLSRLWHGNG